MANYIMEKLSDGMLGEGEKLFPRLVNTQVKNTEYIAEKIEQRTSFTRGDVIGLLTELRAVVEETLAYGDAVKIDGLGLLRPVLGLVGKELRGEWKDSVNRITTGRNVQLKAVSFKADSTLLYKVGSRMKLERMGDQLGRKQPSTTIEERTSMARQYISQHHFMRVTDYASLTGLARSTAANELRLLAKDEKSGIISSGTGVSKIYKLRREA